MKGGVLIFFLLCFVIRTAESLFVRTDQSVIGELFINKLIGIALLGWALWYLKIKWADIGFRKDLFARGVLTGTALGAGAFAIAYTAEMLIGMRAGESPALQFFVTSYGVSGNTQMQGGFVFILICVTGNIVNVVMEEGVFRGLFMTELTKRRSVTGAIILSSALFGLWHIVEPLRNFIDGEQSAFGALMTALLLVIASMIFGVTLCLLFRLTGSLWAGMAVHFINNTGVNLLHVVGASGTDGMQTMRIAIAQALLCVVVVVWYARQKSKLTLEVSYGDDC